MSSSDEAQRFFEKVILDYNCGDIKWFLQKRAKPLGPFLGCVSAGIDTVGGMIYGFHGNNSGARSISFLGEFMDLGEIDAKLIYRCARCGYFHEGIGKHRLSWFAAYKKRLSQDLLYRRTDGGISLNVVAYGRHYLRAIDAIWSEQRERLQCLPINSEKETDLFDHPAVAQLPNLEDAVHGWLDLRGSHSNNDILRKIRFWTREGYLAPDSQ